MCVIVCSDYKDPCTFGTDSDTLFSPVESYFSSSPLPRHSSNDLIDINTAGLSLVPIFFLTSLFAIHCTPFKSSHSTTRHLDHYRHFTAARTP